MKATARNHQSVGRHVITVVLVLAIVLGFGVSPVSADELIAFSNDELLIAEPGTETNLAEVTVTPSNVGRLCTVSVASQNQASIHNGNDLIVTSGEVETVIADVEAEANQATDLSVDIILGPTIAVDLRMGPDWVSSLGFGLWLSCSSENPVLVTGQPVHCPDPQGSSPATVPGGGDQQVAEGANIDCSAAVDDTEPEVDPSPLAAAPVEIPTATPPQGEPLPCQAPDSGSMTVIPTDCPSSEPVDPTPPAAPVEPTPVAPATPPTSPDVEPDPAGTTGTSSADGSKPEVLGIQVERLPQTPAAPAVTANPTYNG